MEQEKKKQIAILGSTGSIGTQALDVIRRHRDLFEVYALTANNNADLLVEQAREFVPEMVVIVNSGRYNFVKDALCDLPVKVWAGEDAIPDVAAAQPVEIVLAAMVGYSGLMPTIAAIKAGKTIALANKETLVVGGELITRLALEYRAPIIPVDSEHSAIFQCLAGEFDNPVEKVILTASGGPFRTLSKQELFNVTKEQALKHPNWDMGAKVTIDSASMMNKGFEMIEAKWLFGLDPSRIEVVIHPQSIIHSMVQFTDASVKAQMGIPDMRLPIQYALGYPKRLPADFPRISFREFSSLTFEEPDSSRFPNLSFAYDAIREGGNMPCILNAANEVAVAAFLEDRIGFMQMSTVLEKTMGEVRYISSPSYEDYVETDAEARARAIEIINK